MIEEFKPFVAYLIEEETLTRSTTRRHLNNLFLLGGELIRRINIYEEDRRLSPRRLLDDSLDGEGGPLCRHAENGSSLREYDATCKALRLQISAFARPQISVKSHQTKLLLREYR